MKTLFSNFKLIGVTVCLLLTGILVNAQRYAVANGNWNATSTWSATLGGTPGASVPVAGENVFIPDGITVTINTTQACANLDINNTNTSGIGKLTFGVSGNLTVSGTVILGKNGGRIGTIDMASGGILKIGVSLSLSNNYTFIEGIGTVDYYGGANQTISNLSSPYNNLTLSGSGAKTVTGVTVNGTLSRQGTATVSGTPTYGSSAILEYAGSIAQSTGSEFPGTLSNLKINNTNGVTLIGGLKTITGLLTLSDGIVTTTTTNLLTLDASASASFTIGSTTSFINGPMAKTGTTAFVFPVGKTGSGGGMRRIGISAPTASSTFRAEFNREFAPNKNSVGSGITQVSACEHWVLDRTGGTGSVAVTLSWSSVSPCNNALYVTDLNDLRVARYNGSQWISEGNAGYGASTNASGTITSNSLSGYTPIPQYFALGSANSGTNPLPVKFNDVKAFEKDKNVQIEWTNLTEFDVENYEIERSSNGIDFTVIATVSAKGNLGSKESYQRLDLNPYEGVNFYRIKANEKDGKKLYSLLLKVMMGEKIKSINLYPNPVQGNMVTYNFAAGKGQYVVRVINGIGQELFTQTLNHQGGTLSQTVTLPASIKRGIYNLIISGANYKEHKSFIVQ